MHDTHVTGTYSIEDICDHLINEDFFSNQIKTRYHLYISYLYISKDV